MVSPAITAASDASTVNSPLVTSTREHVPMGASLIGTFLDKYGYLWNNSVLRQESISSPGAVSFNNYASPDGVDSIRSQFKEICAQMLEVNPAKRPSAEQLLASPFFQSCEPLPCQPAELFSHVPGSLPEQLNELNMRNRAHQ